MHITATTTAVSTPPSAYAVGVEPKPTNWFETKTNDEQMYVIKSAGIRATQ